MELTTADLGKEIGGLVSKLSQLEPEINRAAIDSSATKKVVEEQSRTIQKLEADKQSLEAIIADQHEELKKQQLKDIEHQEAIDKLFRLITETQKRLDGDSITNISYPNYETVRETSKILSDKLSGKGATVSYDEIQTSYTNTRFLAQVFRWMVGLIGFSGVVTVVFTVFGVGGDGRITVQKLSGEVNTLKQNIDTNTKNFETFKNEDFKEFKTSTQNNIKTLYDRQWDALKK